MKRTIIALVLGLAGIGSVMVLGAETIHTVQAGETLFGLSRKYQTTVEAILGANKLTDASKVKAGQKLVIPDTDKTSAPVATSVPTKAPEAAKATEAATQDITIQKGDTLYSLARTWATSVDILRKLNKLGPKDNIRVGQTLKVPRKDEAVDKVDPKPVIAGGDAKVAGTDTVPSGSILDQQKADTNAQKVLWPVEGTVYSMEGKFPGVAIRGVKGSPVRNLVGGKVIYTGQHSSLGNVVFVQGDNGFIYIYGGNETIMVENGNQVAKGAEIGRVGASPGMPDVQAYFTVWKDGDYIDPVQAPR